MDNQFSGMSKEQFTYEDYEFVREKMIKTVQESLTEEDKLSILAFKEVVPDWSTYNFGAYPSIKWKLMNLEKIKVGNPKKHKELYYRLKRRLDNL
jgi:hypothetical protein